MDAIRRHVESNGGHFPRDVEAQVEAVVRQGETPLVVAEDNTVMGVVAQKDIVKGGIKERFAELRKMGIKTVMVTGDNPLTAAAMNSGTQAAKEAGNMVDLDSNPTKLLEVVHIGKQMLMTRGSLTTFSIANDVAKYFAIIPAAFAVTYPALNRLNVMGLHSPTSAILSAVIFNALIIVLLIPLALKGVSYRPMSAALLLRRNLWIYGAGGLLVPFIGIKLIDVLLTVMGLG